MRIRSASTLYLAVGLCWISVLRAQEPPTFEVASIKPNTGEPGPPLIDGRTFRQNGQVTVTNMSLGAMIDVLYRNRPGMLLEGGPGWLRFDRFDIVAKGDPGSDRSIPAGQLLPRMNAMLRALLEERFALRTHVEHRPMRVYALVAADPARPTARLKPAAERCTPGSSTFDAASCASMQFGASAIRGAMMSMGTLASFLERLPGIERPVNDETGIDGFYDIDVQTGVDPRTPAPEQGARIMSALKEQLGLLLRETAGARDVLVIDSAARPTPN